MQHLLSIPPKHGLLPKKELVGIFPNYETERECDSALDLKITTRNPIVFLLIRNICSFALD